MEKYPLPILAPTHIYSGHSYYGHQEPHTHSEAGDKIMRIKLTCLIPGDAQVTEKGNMHTSSIADVKRKDKKARFEQSYSIFNGVDPRTVLVPPIPKRCHGATSSPTSPVLKVRREKSAKV
jgi:hypothetical protein